MSFIVILDSDIRFQGWVENVKNLKKSKVNIERIINRQLKVSKILPNGDLSPKDLEIISHLSKSSFLIYSSYTEANLLRLIHLPNAFTSNEVSDILKKKNDNIIEGWMKAIKLALNKNNVTLEGGITKDSCLILLRKIVKNYLQDPAEIRNKLAHGQWVTAYNRTYTSPNNSITTKIACIDASKIDAWYKIFDKFAELLKQLIQSPNKGFQAQCKRIIDDINNIAQDSVNWSIYTKRARLMKLGVISESKI